jgi:hypothetical protein
LVEGGCRDLFAVQLAGGERFLRAAEAGVNGDERDGDDDGEKAPQNTAPNQSVKVINEHGLSSRVGS